MHHNETYLKNMTRDQLLYLLTEAEGMGPEYVASLKEQLQRLEISL